MNVIYSPTPYLTADPHCVSQCMESDCLVWELVSPPVVVGTFFSSVRLGHNPC
jgi:hypothetical protein